MKNNLILIDDLESQIDKLVRQGQHGKARDLLLACNKKQLNRNQSFKIADLARRLNTPKIILEVLKPFVFGELSKQNPPTESEVALYALGLSRMGAFTEAVSFLKKLDEKKTPEVSLYLGLNSIIQWDYKTAIPYLIRYIKRKDLSPYQRKVGQINLYACYIGEMNWVKSEEFFDLIWSELKYESNTSDDNNYFLLKANTLGLAAHYYFLRGQIDKAEEIIFEATTLLENSKSRYELLVKKWKSIIDLYKNPKNTANLNQFRFMLNEAKKARDWETLRDFDFFEALILQNDQLFLKVLHGTPYASYRKRIKNLYKPRFSIPNSFNWDLNHPSSNSGIKMFDITKGCEQGGEIALTNNPLLLKLFKLFTKDFYRPLALGTIFSNIYPNEQYNTYSSPNRVYLLIKRLRLWFIKNNLPLIINVYDIWYKLEATGPYLIRVTYQNSLTSPFEPYLEHMASLDLNKSYSIEELIPILSISQSTVKKFISWGIKKRKIKRIKDGRSSLYRFL